MVTDASAVDSGAGVAGQAYLVHNEHDIRTLLDWLRQHLPHSSKLFHTLLTCLTPYRQHQYPSLYANSLAVGAMDTVMLVYSYGNRRTYYAQRKERGDSDDAVIETLSASDRRTAAAVNADADTDTDSDSDSANDYQCCFFTINTSTAIAMIERYLDLSRTLYFAGIETQYRSLVTDVRCRYEARHTDTVIGTSIDDNYHWNLRHPSHLRVPPFDPSLTYRRLAATDSNAQYISDRWKYSSTRTPMIVKELLRAFECYGLYDGDRLVSYAVKQPYGAIGMLHVLDEYRGRQIGQQLIARMCQRLTDQRLTDQRLTVADSDSAVYDEWTPFCYINIGNVASEGLFSALGFVREFPVDWVLWNPTPVARQ